jgi:integrase
VAGVKAIKFHGCRHTVAPPHVIAARLGHSVMELMKRTRTACRTSSRTPPIGWARSCTDKTLTFC